MTARRLIVVAVAGALFVSGGCGSSGAPTAPTAPFSVSGTWTGTFEYVTAGVTVTDEVTLILTQPSTSASGSWSAGSAATGTASFGVASSVTGNFTISQPNVGGAPCTGSSTLSGSASSTSLVLNIANLTPTAACPWATGMKLTLKK